jgi:hypothetical protein
MVRMVAAVGEPTGGVGWRDGGEGGPGGGAELILDPGLGPAEGQLDLREGVLDRSEVRGVGRQREELGAACLDRGPDTRRVMGAEVVGDDDLPRSESRGEDVADVAPKRSPVMPPSNRMSARTPSSVSAATTVLSSPGFRAAAAFARLPRGAQA